ncbi:MAG: NTP transferase domain-containing protein [Nitrospinota bacterium]|nr:NTP transferase domain-containing protein [Nitrospinota bacterium]
MSSNIDSIDAVILAGGKESRFGILPINKNMLLVKNRPLFIHILFALLEVKRIGRIFITGPADEIKRILKEHGGDIPSGKVFPVQESTDIVANVWIAFIHSLVKYKPGDEDNDEELREKLFFACAGDMPLATPMEIDEFLDGCKAAGDYDWFMGMTRKETLDFYKPKKRRRGIRMAYSHFAEGLYRINNLHLFKPFKIKNKNEFTEFYRVRYLRRFSNILKSGIGILRRNVGLEGLFGWAFMILAMKLYRMGFISASDYFRKFVPIERGEKVVSRLIGGRSKTVITTYGGCALDVDRKGNRALFERQYDQWMEHQYKLADKRGLSKKIPKIT